MNKEFRIQVNGEFLDTIGNATVSLNYSAGRLQEIETRRGITSYEITIPLTIKNNTILRNNQNLNSKLFFDNNNINTGFIKVVDKNLVNKTIKIIFFSGNNNWFRDIKDRTLFDLDFYNDGFIWNIDTFISPPKNISFLLLNNGILTEERFLNKTNLIEFTPAIKTKAILKNIFDSIGYVSEGSLFNDSKFERDYILLEKRKDGISQNRVSELSSEYLLDGEYLGGNIINPITIFDITTIKNNNTPLGNQLISIPQQDVTANFTFNTNIDYKCKIEIQSLDQNNIQSIKLVTGTRGISRNFTEVNGLYNRSENVIFEDGKILSIEIDALTVDELQTFEIGFIPEVIPNAPLPRINSLLLKVTFEPIGGFLRLNSYIYPELNLPEIKQTDFVKELAIDYALIFDVNENGKQVFINKFNDLEDVKTTPIKWDDKVVNGELFTEDYIEVTSNYAQLNLFKRNNDIGNSFFTLNNELLDEEIEIFTSEFNGLEPSNIFNNTIASSLLGGYSFEVPENQGNNTRDRILRVTPSPENLLRIEVPFEFGSNRTENLIGEYIKLGSFDETNIVNFYPQPLQIIEVESFSFSQTPVLRLTLNVEYVDLSFNNSITTYYSLINRELDYENIRVIKERNSLFTNVTYGLTNSSIFPDIGFFTRNNIIGTVDTNINNLSYESIINDYYGLITRMLNKNIYLRTEIFLTEVDIRNLKFATPIIYKNKTYFIDEIENYDGTIGEIKLIEI